MLYESPFEVKNVDETYSELAKSRGVIVFGTGNCGNIVIAAAAGDHVTDSVLLQKHTALKCTF